MKTASYLMFSNVSKASLCRFHLKMWDLPQIMAVEMKPLQLKVRVSIEQRHVRSFPLNHWKNKEIRFKSRFCCLVPDRIKIQGLLYIFEGPVRDKFMWIQPLGIGLFLNRRKEKQKYLCQTDYTARHWMTKNIWRHGEFNTHLGPEI